MARDLKRDFFSFSFFHIRNKSEQRMMAASRLENVTQTIARILEGYDIRLRPNFGGIQTNTVCIQLINFVLLLLSMGDNMNNDYVTFRLTRLTHNSIMPVAQEKYFYVEIELWGMKHQKKFCVFSSFLSSNISRIKPHILMSKVFLLDPSHPPMRCKINL